MNYHAYICCCPADIRKARDLSRALKRYRIPRGLSSAEISGRLAVFLPESGGSLEALGDSAFLVVLCSRRSALDPRVDAEIRTFKRLGRPHRILTLILDGEPNAADGKPNFTPADECFAESLKYDLGPDGELDPSRPTEPIAADDRPNKDGHRAAVLKIIAGLLGVGFDDLYQRDQRRRRQRLFVIRAASLLLASVLGVLAVQAVFSEQKSRAQLASTREVNAYITSLFANVDRPALQKLDPKLMSLILDKSERELDQAKPPPTPGLEAQMRQILGQAYLACGLWDKAASNLQRALTLSESLLGPGDSTSLVSRRDLGEALIGEGKLAAAKGLLSQVPPSGATVVRYQLARALALTGDSGTALQLLTEEIKVRPEALAQALDDSAFTSIRSQLPAPHP